MPTTRSEGKRTASVAETTPSGTNITTSTEATTTSTGTGTGESTGASHTTTSRVDTDTSRATTRPLEAKTSIRGNMGAPPPLQDEVPAGMAAPIHTADVLRDATNNEEIADARTECSRREEARRKKARKIARARQKMLEIKLELAAATLAAMEEDNSEDEEGDAGTEISELDATRRTSEWVQTQTQQLAIDSKPYQVSTITPPVGGDPTTPLSPAGPTPAGAAPAGDFPANNTTSPTSGVGAVAGVPAHYEHAPPDPSSGALPMPTGAVPVTPLLLQPPRSQGAPTSVGYIPAAPLQSACPMGARSTPVGGAPTTLLQPPHPQGVSIPAGCTPAAPLQSARPMGAPTENYNYDPAGVHGPVAPAGVQALATVAPNPLADLTTAITMAIAAGQTQRRAVDLPVFAGSHQYWLAFKAAYSESCKQFSESENVARLRNSVKGRARESIEELFICGAHAEEIMKALESRFGRPDAIALAELERLRGLPRLSDNPRDICVFASRVSNIVATLRALDRQYYLYNPEVTKCIIDKFSMNTRYRWFDFAVGQPKEEADLLKLSRFLQREADICGPFAPPEYVQSSGQQHHPLERRPQRTHAAIEKKTCPLCKSTTHTSITDCSKFNKAPPIDRWDLARRSRVCFRCLRHRAREHKCPLVSCGVSGCDKQHHKLLHVVREAANALPAVSDATTETVSCAWSRGPQSYLKILRVRVSGPSGEQEAWALLDDGSTVTLVDEQLADQVGASGPVDPLHIEAIADTNIKHGESKRVKITLSGGDRSYEVQARTVSNLSLSMQRVEEEIVRGCAHLQDLQDELTYDCARPNILIGQDNWHLLVAHQMRRGRQNQPVASHTPLGWVLHGAHTRALGHRVNFINNIEDAMDKRLEQYFSIESLTINPAKPKSDPEVRAVQLLEETVKEAEPGKYEAGLLWRNDKVTMPYNYDNALSRLHGVEKKLDKNADLKRKYEAQMDAFITKGYAELAPTLKTPGKTWYLPHFAVVNPMKPEKTRIVQDAAARTKGVSLNDHLLSGPDLLQSLPGVMMRFRRHAVGVTADIAEMFMRVKVREEDRDALRYLWRGGERGDTPPKEYRMTSLIFGATCSPSIAIYVKNVNAEKYRSLHPEATDAIIKNHYVDDYLDSFRTEAKAIEVAQQVRKIHSEGNFDLRGWVSNSKAVMAAMGAAADDQPNVNLDDSAHYERVLGLIWKPDADQLSFNLNMARIPPGVLSCGCPTKREALKIVMSLYDPLGFASPVTVRAKCILQEAWRRGVDWDTRLPNDLAEQWREWLTHLENLRHVYLPRAYPGYSDATSLQLHVLVDASEAAYTAALYWRTVTPDHKVHVSLIIAKARVAPLKLTSIPRLELQAAVMGARMADAVKKEHERQPDNTTYWTDSKTVLHWLRNGSRTYRPFVAHRVAAIEELSKVNEWRWVPTKLNTADDATRDVPQGFSKTHRWFTGPEFLKSDEQEWPTEKATPIPSPSTEATPPVITTGEEKCCVITQRNNANVSEAIPMADKFSKWEKYLRATARVLQFIELCRSKEKTHFKRTKANPQQDADWEKQPTRAICKKPARPAPQQHKRYIAINTNLLQHAEILIIRASQQQSFKEDLKALRNGQQIPPQSKLRSVSVELNNNGVIQLHSRIAAAQDVPSNVRNPPLLDGRHPAAKLYILYVHRKLGHARVELTINEVKQRYWVLHLRPTTRQLLHRCLPCIIRRATPTSPPTGDHPACRLAHHQRAFTYTGLDYFGPVSVTVGRGTQKRYVALFTCLTTRAIHLEVAHSLSTNSAIMALSRMVARRGCPTELWSDNGTNLRGADKELRKALDAATEEEAAKRGINWRFIPPGAPFMGGAWERMVRAVKTALEVTLHERHPSEETLLTLLAEAEFTVNSRPLTHVSVDPADPEALTPNHFILGGSAWTPTPGTFKEEDLVGRATWRTSQRLADQFWARWLKEYLPELQHRREPWGRGPPLTIGNVVLIADNTLPRNTWPRGIVTAVYPGADGIVRAADVQTKGGVLRRPTKKLIILPTGRPTPSETSTPAAMNGGSNVRDDTHRAERHTR